MTLTVDRPDISFIGKQKPSTFIPDDLTGGETRSVATHISVFTRTKDPEQGICAWTQIVGFFGAVDNKSYGVEGLDDVATDPDNGPPDPNGNPLPLSWGDMVQFSAIHPRQTWYTASRDFDIWLMYHSQTPGAIWVPLAKASWFTRANGTWNADDEVWVKGDFSPTTNPGIFIPPFNSTPTNAFPLWDKGVTKEEIQHELGLE
jgi:hypothetical protein